MQYFFYTEYSNTQLESETGSKINKHQKNNVLPIKLRQGKEINTLYK